MKNFIEVTDSNGNRHLINIQHIEEIAEKTRIAVLYILMLLIMAKHKTIM